MVKNMRKLTILMIAVVAIGTFALPNVLTASQGQHQFYAGSQVQCNKCHNLDNNAGAGVALEVASSNLTDYRTADGDPDNLNQWTESLTGYNTANITIHKDVGCKGCHTVTNKKTNTSRQIVTSTHAGVSRQVTCTTCHPHVIGTGQELLGADEVHNSGVVGPNGLTGLAGVGNTACIGCHTNVGVTGSVSYGFTFAAQPIGTSGLNITATP